MKRWLAWAGGTILALAVIFAGILWLAYAKGVLNTDPSDDGGEGYAVIHSPDHRFRLVVHQEGSFWPTMPGQSGDGPGYVVLLDDSDKELARAHLDMVQRIFGSVVWTKDEVHIKFVATWPLPSGPRLGQRVAVARSPVSPSAGDGHPQGCVHPDMRPVLRLVCVQSDKLPPKWNRRHGCGYFLHT